MTDNMTALSLRGVTKKSGPFTLGPIDLQIEKGYRVAVVGPNGSGKTTLFHLIQNLIRPDAGEVQLLGMLQPEAEVRIKEKIGYMPDSAFGYEGMTPADAAEFMKQWYPGWSEARFSEMCGKLEINPQQKIAKMSKGTKQRVLFLLALARDPELILLDEPTANLDPFAARKMMEEISALLEDGSKTVIFATHVMEEVRKYADYVAFLYRGKLLGYFEKDEIMDSWKELWVEGAAEAAVRMPGVVSAEGAGPVRVITSDRRATERAFREQGIAVLKVHNLELDEIFAGLMSEYDRGRG
ncbi:ABC-2 type transport system ATP-binding protein [Tumebacillus sp. BK434]|uniref:ABC transporter ATP-binding protein n=1 Tax=Tumebacillus sp. BK434 TaxID=2512169 RepID=UPI001043D8B9|nr:ABC transporter ATP-binding protein [Tumebacillus sp. BK434]TCP52113.1 ABC-2 type transport system ATP-binding protein [Tumebacillus sp. BK434]